MKRATLLKWRHQHHTLNSLVCCQAEAQLQRDQRYSELTFTASTLLARQKEAAPLAGQHLSPCFVPAL